MFEKFMKKHVIISMSNGSTLQGFLDNVTEQYLDLVELDNQQVMVRLLDISFIRTQMGELVENCDNKASNPQQYASHEPIQDPIVYKAREEEYSMTTPQPQDGPYAPPKFVRSTKK